jgi:hypothetical protein
VKWCCCHSSSAAWCAGPAAPTPGQRTVRLAGPGLGAAHALTSGLCCHGHASQLVPAREDSSQQACQ